METIITKEAAVEKEIKIDRTHKKLIGSESFHRWLRESVSEECDLPRWVRVSFLVQANGGWEINGCGFVAKTPGEHQHGLSQNEALELLFFSGFFGGASMYTGFDLYAEFYEYFKAYGEFFVETNQKSIDEEDDEPTGKQPASIH